MFTAMIRTKSGAWQYRAQGKTLRDAKRALAKKAGLTLRVVDPLPLGKSMVEAGGWNEVLVKEGW